MAVLLRHLCERAAYMYEMRMLAGESGSGNVVQWIHTLEDVETGTFIHGGELVFTTGIASRGDDWLMRFVRNLYEQEASGLVVNIGPYIDSIPREVLDFCNQAEFPLMSVPWKTRLVEITRDFSIQIFQDEKEEENLAETLKNIIFDAKNISDYLPVLSRNNFNINGMFCILGVDIDFLNRNIYRQKMFRAHLLRLVDRMKGVIAYFVTVDTLFFVLNDFSNEEIHELTAKLEEQENSDTFALKIAVGKNEAGAASLGRNYQKVRALLPLVGKDGRHTLFYDEMGVKKILLSVEETSVLEEYYEETLGALERYDRENDTDFLNLLKRYLETGCSVQLLAEEYYVHRNTIHYQLGKIRKILRDDISTPEGRFRLNLAFQVRDFIS